MTDAERFAELEHRHARLEALVRRLISNLAAQGRLAVEFAQDENPTT